MIAVDGADEDVHMRLVLVNIARQFGDLVFVIDRSVKQLGVLNPRWVKQVRTHRVPKIIVNAKCAQILRMF